MCTGAAPWLAGGRVASKHPVRPDADDDVGAGGAGEQAAGRLLGVGGAAEQDGLAGVAAQPVAAGEHRIEHLGGDLRGERARVDEQQDAGGSAAAQAPRAGPEPGGTRP